jgi:hypothetical protein
MPISNASRGSWAASVVPTRQPTMKREYTSVTKAV